MLEFGELEFDKSRLERKEAYDKVRFNPDFISQNQTIPTEKREAPVI